MRRTGQTTRLIDEAIQEIFKGETWEARDHHMFGTNRQSNEYLFNGVIKRLTSEHNLVGVNPYDRFEIDKKNLKIKLQQA